MDTDNIKERESFGAILRRVRKEKKLTLVEMCDEIGTDENGKPLLSPSYLHRLESGERDNPTIQIVGLLTEKLDLDLREVLKCYGFEQLINPQLQGKLDNIVDMIRLSDIKIMNDERNRNGRYISQSEKEILIKAIQGMFDYSVADGNELPIYISNMIEMMNQFRESSTQESKVIANICGRQISIIYGKDVTITIDEMEWTIDYFIRLMERVIGGEQLDIQGDYYIYDKNWNVLIKCEMLGDTIRVRGISRNINSVDTGRNW